MQRQSSYSKIRDHPSMMRHGEFSGARVARDRLSQFDRLALISNSSQGGAVQRQSSYSKICNHPSMMRHGEFSRARVARDRLPQFDRSIDLLVIRTSFGWEPPFAGRIGVDVIFVSLYVDADVSLVVSSYVSADIRRYARLVLISVFLRKYNCVFHRNRTDFPIIDRTLTASGFGTALLPTYPEIPGRACSSAKKRGALS